MCMPSAKTPQQQVVAPTPQPTPMKNPDDTPNANTVGGQRAASAGRNSLRIDLTQPVSPGGNGLTIPQG